LAGHRTGAVPGQRAAPADRDGVAQELGDGRLPPAVGRGVPRVVARAAGTARRRLRHATDSGAVRPEAPRRPNPLPLGDRPPRRPARPTPPPRVPPATPTRARRPGPRRTAATPPFRRPAPRL